MSDHPRCPLCGAELEGWTDPEEGAEMAKFYFEGVRMSEALAVALEETRERRLEAEAESYRYSKASGIPYSDALVERFRQDWRTAHPEPEALRAWRLTHPKRSPHPGDNAGDRSPEKVREA